MDTINRRDFLKVSGALVVGFAASGAVTTVLSQDAGGKPPLIPRGALIFLESHAVPDASRVRSELGLEITPWDRGIAGTVERFRAQGWRTAA